MEHLELTVDEGIMYQDVHLADWKRKLIPEMYVKLHEYAKRTNCEAKTGYEIRRGNDLDTFVSNL